MNKFLFKFFCLLNFFNTIILCDSDQEKFLRANTFFNNEKYKEAFDLYNSMLNKGMREWFNIANSQYKLKNYAYSIAAWKKALKYANFNDFEKIEYNIEKAVKKLNLINNNSFFDNLYNLLIKYLSLISVFELQIFLLILFYITIILWILKIINKYLLIILLLFNIVCLSLFFIKYNEQNKKIGFVIAALPAIFAGTDKNYHIIGVLDILAETKIIKQHGEWIKILNGNLIGWIQKDLFLDKI